MVYDIASIEKVDIPAEIVRSCARQFGDYLHITRGQVGLSNPCKIEYHLRAFWKQTF